MRTVKIQALALAASLALAAAAPLPADVLRVFFPDVEQGSATLVVSPTGKALLIDAGSENRAADDDIVRFVEDLMAAGVVTSLEGTLATHYDEDHIGHLEDVLSHGLLSPTGTAWDRGELRAVPTSFAYSDYAWAASFRNRTTVTPGQVIDLGGGVTVTVKVVNGQLPGGGSVDISTSNQMENAASAGVLVEHGDVDLWIAGDLTGNTAEYGVANVEAAVAPFVGDVDVYVVHHHGSRTSSTAGFLSAIAAEVAINQSSADNDFGHPNAIVVNQILGTPDSCGDVPLFVQQNPGNPTDDRSDDTLADGIADPDDVDRVVGLPGTILLASDGTSYQISGGDVAPITLPADCSSSAVGDFPPAVLTLSRAPWVPLATEAVTVEAAVRDEGMPSVALEWSVDGVAQTPLAMSNLPGTHRWQATIPARPDGARVTYAVRATDAAGGRAVSRPSGYFSGTAPIAALRVNDARGVLVPAELAARIEGRITVEPGVLHDFVSQVFVQDDAGAGIQVFDGELLAIERGDRVRFVGELEQFAGQTELNVAQDFGGYGHQIVSAGAPPAPVTITVSQVGEAFEGRLVRIDGVTVISGTIPGPGAGNGELTVTDDGGVSTLTVRIDGDTDIPGAGTPTGAFDVVGVITQFDAWPPLASGYQLVPRERADLLSEEVNLPAVVIHEAHADPHASLGDANGDGAVSSTADEFVELANTTYAPIDVSGWTLADAVGVKHTFPAGTVIPAREAAVVFGGGSPAGAFGNAAANGLVFTASAGTLGLNNTGDTVTLRDAANAVVQALTYGSEGGQDESLTRSPDLSNSPMKRHTQADPSGARRFSPGTWASDGGAFTVPPGALVLSEVLYDAANADDGLEWVEIVNTTEAAIDLSKRPVALAWGGGDWTAGGVTLDAGVVQPCTPFVVGGPTSSADNASPAYDLVATFSPALQNSGTDADGVALFNLPFAYVTGSMLPVDAVIYGPANTNCLKDETGACATPEVADAPGGSSIERVATGWRVQAAPTPNASPLAAGGCAGGPSCLGAATLLPGDLVLSEVLYDPSGADDGFEWVELYNASGEEVCLEGLSLGWGGADYAGGGEDLAGTLAPGATFLVGGPSGGPSYGQVANFSPDLQNSGAEADGVALFLVPEAQVTASTVPYDAVIYGPSNSSCLLDETGSCASPDVGDAASPSSIERTSLAGAWQVQAAPTPGTTPLP